MQNWKILKMQYNDIFVLFSIQDWSNWSFELANNMIYQIAAFAWLIFGMLLVWFSVGDYKESKSG